MAETTGNKLIAKNTLMLYIRMLYSLFISLFTARVVLNALGFEDYGLYNVIGSIVTMFVSIRLAMGNAVQRFITFALGKGDEEELHRVFSMSMKIHFYLAALILLLCETIGLWFLNAKLVIPEGRLFAANCVYQFSVFTCALSVICAPYDATIIAHEKFGIYAVIQVVNTTLNLFIVFAVKYFPQDKLIFYAFLLMMVQVMNRLVYGIYCGRHFPETKYKKVKNKALFKDMVDFAGWSLFGNVAYIGFTQGINILLNLFFGAAVNAARGIAVNVQTSINGFVSNFQLAVSPQIIKSCSSNDMKRMNELIFLSSKYSFCLLFCFVLPIVLEAPTILRLWLVNYPDYSVVFLHLILAIALISTLENPLSMANSAVGHIKWYQIICGSMLLLILPMAYIVLKLGGSPETVFVVHLIIVIATHCVRLLLSKKRFGLSIRSYLRHIVVPLVAMAVTASILPFFVKFFFYNEITEFIVVTIVSLVSVVLASYFIALSKNEQVYVRNQFSKIFDRFVKH